MTAPRRKAARSRAEPVWFVLAAAFLLAGTLTSFGAAYGMAVHHFEHVRSVGGSQR